MAGHPSEAYQEPALRRRMLLPPRTKPEGQGMSRIAKEAMDLNEKIQELEAQALRMRDSSSRAEVLKLRFAELTS